MVGKDGVARGLKRYSRHDPVVGGKKGRDCDGGLPRRRESDGPRDRFG